MPRCLIIDGYNVIHRMKSLAPQHRSTLESARNHLVNLIKDFLSRKKIFNRAIIVFDSKEDTPFVRRYPRGNIELVFGTKDRDADKVIVEILKKGLPGATVCSSDNFVLNHARAFGYDTMPAEELESIIILKKKGRGSKIVRGKIDSEEADRINRELKEYWGL